MNDENDMQTYHQYCVLVDYEYTKYADADWLSVQTIQKYVYLTTKHLSTRPSGLLLTITLTYNYWNHLSWFRNLTDTDIDFINGPPTHNVRGQTCNGRWCLSSSVTRRICNVTHQGQHAAGQSCYVPLWRHLVNIATRTWFVQWFVHKT